MYIRNALDMCVLFNDNTKLLFQVISGNYSYYSCHLALYGGNFKSCISV